MTLKEMQDRAYGMAKQKGFHSIGELLPDNRIAIPKALFEKLLMAVKIVLIHSELSELVEEIRSSETNWDHADEEMADILIRMGDLAGLAETNLDRSVTKKMTINASRPHKHGREF